MILVFANNHYAGPAGREVNLDGLRCEDFEVDCLPDTRDEFPRAAEYGRLEVG